MSMFKDLFRSKQKYATVRSVQGEDGEDRRAQPREVPDGVWTKCPRCQAMLYQQELIKNYYVCEECGHYLNVTAHTRLEQLLDDADKFVQWDDNLATVNALGFPEYEDKLKIARERTGMDEAVITGLGTVEGRPVALGILDFSFFSGSMGSVAGEKLTRLFERGAKEADMVVVVSGGGGGARMQEGILSLMQMAKTSQAVERFGHSGKPYVSILTHPTMGGVYASFASLGDYIFAEPGALIGFAGPRIVERTIRQALPSGFQTSEFALKNGMVDRIVERKDLRPMLAHVLRLHGSREGA